MRRQIKRLAPFAAERRQRVAHGASRGTTHAQIPPAAGAATEDNHGASRWNTNAQMIPSPGRGDRSIQHKPRIKRHLVLPQYRHQLLIKRDLAMMLFLPRDISHHRVAIRITHRERRIPSLPPKSFAQRPLLMHPLRRTRFQIATQIGQTGIPWQQHQQMHMIPCSIDGQCGSFEGTNNPSQVRVKIIPNFIGD